MKVSGFSIAIVTSMACVASAQTWSVKFWGANNCLPDNIPIQQRTGTANLNCRQLAIVNGFSNSFKFNGANAFSAQMCRGLSCTDCDDPSCDSDGTTCVPGVPNEPYRSFLVTRDENCNGRRLD